MSRVGQRTSVEPMFVLRDATTAPCESGVPYLRADPSLLLSATGSIALTFLLLPAGVVPTQVRETGAAYSCDLPVRAWEMG
jgi:hypothetical protein